MSLATFHSVPTAQMPQSGNVGDIWYNTDSHLIFFVAGDGLLYQLLVAVPIPVQGATGATGPAGIQGAVGPAFPTTWQYSGTWTPSPVEYVRGTVTSYNGFLYVSLADLNISLNVLNPQGNPYWAIVGPVSTTRTSAVVCFIDGAGVPLAAPSTHGVFSFPFTGTIVGWTLTSDVVGSASLDILACSYANFPGGLASIVGGNNPTLTASQKNEQLNVSGLFTQTSFNQGDQLQFVLDSASSVTQLTLTLILSATN
jgi:hypothetical protein